MNDKKTSEFFDKLCEMWEKGESHKEELDNYYGYLDGSNFKNPADSFFNNPDSQIASFLSDKCSNQATNCDNSVVCCVPTMPTTGMRPDSVGPNK